MKEDLSSPGQGSFLPLTPASTPEQPVQTKKQIEDGVTNSAAQTENIIKHSHDELKPTKVTIGVNTGTSLLRDDSTTGVRCCECIRYNFNCPPKHQKANVLQNIIILKL